MTRKEFLSEVAAPVFLRDTAQEYGKSKGGRFFVNLIFKNFGLFRDLFTEMLANMRRDSYAYAVLKDVYDLSEEQVRDYLDSKKIERGYLRILWKHCKKRHTEFKIARRGEW